MVSSLRLGFFSALFGFVLYSALSSTQGVAADDGLVCVNASRDWRKSGETMALEAARSFLRNRVKHECPQLRARVEQRVRTLETAARQRNEKRKSEVATKKPAPTPAPRRPEPKVARPAVPAPQPRPYSPPPTLAPPPAGFQYMETSRFRIWQPDWYQVLARYPQLERLYDRGGEDLCARCVIGASGYLQDCAIAGAAAADPSIRRGAQTMISMIYVQNRDGTSAAGSTQLVPVHFGKWRPAPARGYCRNPASEFRR